MTLGVLPSILYFTVSWRRLSIQILQNFIVHHVPLIFANIEELCQPHILLHGGQVTVPYRFPQLVALSFWRKQFWHWQCWIWKQQYTNMMWPRERFMCIGIHAFHECDSCSCSGQCPASSHDIWSFGTIYAFWGLQCTWPISTYRKLILSCVWGGSRWWPSADELMNANLCALRSMLCSRSYFPDYKLFLCSWLQFVLEK